MTDPLSTDDYEYCQVCGCCLELESCWKCGGEGGEYPYETDPIGYDPDEFFPCDVCEGKGDYLVCPNAEHHPRGDA